MYIIAFLLPLMALGAAFFYGVNSSYWWAYALITAAAEGLVYLVFWFKTRSIEYLSGYVTRVEHHYAWVERSEHTEYKTDSKGKSYTVKRVEYVNHPPEYHWMLNTGKDFLISSDTFSRMCRRWGTGRYQISVYHPNCVRGGGGEACDWDGHEYHTETVTYTHRYRNPVKNSHSIFRGQRIGGEEAGELGLFDYPAVTGEQDVVLVSPGLKYTGDLGKANFELQHLNAFCGSLHEIHAFILLFPAEKGAGIALKQRDYWEGCNKNEFVVCLGMDGDKVAWCHTLSWMDEPTLDVAVKDWFVHHKTPSMTQFVSWLRDNLGLWRRKEFKDFRYLGWNMSQRGSVWFWLTALATSLTVLLCSFWIGGWPAENHRRHEAAVEAERLYQTELRLTDEAQRRAPGVYYFAARMDLFRVEIKGDGTLTAEKLPNYSYKGYSGTQYYEEGDRYSGTWQVNDPRANLDIVLHSNAFGYTDLRISGNRVYEVRSYEGDKPVSSCITEAEYERLSYAAKSRFSGTRWVKDTTASWVYEDDWGLPYKKSYSFHDWLELHADGSFEAGGSKHYNPYDRGEIYVQGEWKLVALQPESGETYDFAGNRNWGLVLRVSDRDRTPQWISSLDYVSDRRDYDTREFLIVNGTGLPLPKGFTESGSDTPEGVVTEEEIIEAERDLPYDEENYED